MAIPEAQLNTWSHQGSVTQSSGTYQTVRNALTAASAPYAGRAYDVFLQGSYGNDTNIYAESDVDTVIRLDAIYGYDLSGLPADQQAAFRQAFGPATYTFAEFKQGVATRLADAFGARNVSFGTKTFKIEPNGARRKTDVLACYQYRYYTRFVSHADYLYFPGVTFPTSSGEWIVNYPKLHSDNCTAKHQATNGWFKPTVRIFKNMRTRLVAGAQMADGVAPSYYIEGMLYNVPVNNFGPNYVTTFCNCLTWLINCDKSQLKCANGMHSLLGNSRVQWTEASMNLFLNGLARLWNDWR
jgi:hypothetical protein